MKEEYRFAKKVKEGCEAVCGIALFVIFTSLVISIDTPSLVCTMVGVFTFLVVVIAGYVRENAINRMIRLRRMMRQAKKLEEQKKANESIQQAS